MFIPVSLRKIIFSISKVTETCIVVRDVAVTHLLSVGPIFKGSEVAQVRVTVGTERFSFSKRSYTSASYKNCGTMTLT